MVDFSEIAKLDKIKESKKYNPISDCINDFSFSETDFAMFMAADHPTLQQNFMKASVAFIREMAKKKIFDDRNEKSVKLAQKIVESGVLDNAYLPCI